MFAARNHQELYALGAIDVEAGGFPRLCWVFVVDGGVDPCDSRYVFFLGNFIIKPKPQILNSSFHLLSNSLLLYLEFARGTGLVAAV